MAHVAGALRVNVVDLLRHPGATRTVEVSLGGTELDIDDDRLAGEIVVEMQATSSVDGITVHGTASSPWQGVCRRCLTEVGGVAVAAIDEVYQQAPRLVDAIQIVGDQIDLAPVVREYVLLELPIAPLCRPDCAGICPECGVDRNAATCSCETTVRDDRWTALDALRLDDTDS